MEETKSITFDYPEKVIIKRIPKTGFFGIGAYNKSTTTLNVELSGKTGRYKTGLSKEEEEYYESALRLPKGTLAPYSEWWGDLDIKLENSKQNILYIDSPLMELKYRVLLESSKVANSDIEKHKNPLSVFYIVDEEAKAKAEVENIDYEFEAYELLMGLKPDEKRQSLRLFGKKGVDSLSEVVVKAELSKYIKTDAKGFVSILKDKKLKTRLLIEELLDYKIISRHGNYFKNGDDPIGNSTEEVIEYFEDIKNQSVKLALESKLKKVKKG